MSTGKRSGQSREVFFRHTHFQNKINSNDKSPSASFTCSCPSHQDVLHFDQHVLATHADMSTHYSGLTGPQRSSHTHARTMTHAFPSTSHFKTPSVRLFREKRLQLLPNFSRSTHLAAAAHGWVVDFMILNTEDGCTDSLKKGPGLKKQETSHWLCLFLTSKCGV